MKRYLSLLLVSLLCFSMLLATACGETPAESDDTGNAGTTTGVGVSTTAGNGANDSTTTSGDVIGGETTGSNVGGTNADPSATTTGSNGSGNATTGGNQNNKTTGGKVTGTTSKYVKDTSARNLKGRTIVYTVYWDELKKGSSALANSYWKNKEALEMKYNCKIKHVFKSRDAIDNEIIPSILAGSPITDVMCIVTDRMYNYAKKGLLYPLDTLKQFDFSEDKWNPAATEMSKYKGHSYGMMATQKPYLGGAMLYNKDLFKKKGLDDPFQLQMKGKKAWNWDSFRKLCKDVTGGDVYGLTHYGIPGDGVGEFLGANMASNVTRDKNGVFKSSVATKNMINALKLYQDMFVVDKSIPFLNSNENGKEMFISGKVGFYKGGSHDFFAIAERANFEMGLVLVPAGPDSTLEYGICNTDSTFYCMPSNIKNPEDVAAVLDGYLGSESNSNWEARWYDLFYSEEVLETLKLNNKLLAEGKYYTAYGGFIADKYELGYFGQWNSVAQGQMTPAQAVESMQSLIQNAVNKLNEE